MTGEHYADREQDLLQRFGELLPTTELSRLLGYRSTGALRKAVARKTLPLETFQIPHRRGHFARTRLPVDLTGS